MEKISSSSSCKPKPETLINYSHHLLSLRDFSGSRQCALVAQEYDPTLQEAFQILAIADVLMAAERHMPNNRPDYYSILNVTRPESESLKGLRAQFTKLLTRLNPGKNKFPFCREAFELVCDAWSVLSNVEKREKYDIEIGIGNTGGKTMDNGSNGGEKNEVMGKDAISNQTNEILNGGKQKDGILNQRDEILNGGKQKDEILKEHKQKNGILNQKDGTLNEERQKGRMLNDEDGILNKGKRKDGVRKQKDGILNEGKGKGGSFWTVCPYCYCLFEYEKVYRECCLRCQKCRRGFQAVEVGPLPPSMVVDGKNEYYCAVGFCLLGYAWGGFFSPKKANSGRKVGGMKKVPVISDDSDDEDDDNDEKGLNVENGGRGVNFQEVKATALREKCEGLRVKVQIGELGVNSQEAKKEQQKRDGEVTEKNVSPGMIQGRLNGKRVKSVARNTKKGMWRQMKKLRGNEAMASSPRVGGDESSENHDDDL